FHAECDRNPARQLVLQVEDVAHLAVVAIAPQLYATDSIYELDRNADPVHGTAHATLNHVTGSHLPAEFRHVDRASLELQCGSGGDHAQVAEPRQVGDNVFR